MGVAPALARGGLVGAQEGLLHPLHRLYKKKGGRDREEDSEQAKKKP